MFGFKAVTPYLQGSCAQDAGSLILGHVPRGDPRPVTGLCLLLKDLHALFSFGHPILVPVLLVVCLQSPSCVVAGMLQHVTGRF